MHKYDVDFYDFYDFYNVSLCFVLRLCRDTWLCHIRYSTHTHTHVYTRLYADADANADTQCTQLRFSSNLWSLPLPLPHSFPLLSLHAIHSPPHPSRLLLCCCYLLLGLCLTVVTLGVPLYTFYVRSKANFVEILVTGVPLRQLAPHYKRIIFTKHTHIVSRLDNESKNEMAKTSAAAADRDLAPSATATTNFLSFCPCLLRLPLR